MSEQQGHASSDTSGVTPFTQSVFDNVKVGGNVSFRDLLQVLLVPSGVREEKSSSIVKHNLPQPEYGFFIGREQDLTKVFKKLRPYPHSTNSVITIDGIGGIGKSALALEVAHRFLRDYEELPSNERFSSIVWSSAKQTILKADRGIVSRRQPFQTLHDICKAIAITLEIEEESLGREEIIDIVCRTLTKQRTLLIIDNLETVDDESVMEFLQELLPAPTKAIVTTRHRIDVAYPVRLVGMSWEDAKQLIDQECSKKDVSLTDDEQCKLYERTGGVPLAIVWTVARIGLGYKASSVFASLGSPKSDIAHFCFREVVDHIKNDCAFDILLALSAYKGEADRNQLRYVTDLEEDEFSFDEGIVALNTLSLVNKKADVFTMLPLTREYANCELLLLPDFEERVVGRIYDYQTNILVAKARKRMSRDMSSMLSRYTLSVNRGRIYPDIIEVNLLAKSEDQHVEIQDVLNLYENNKRRHIFSLQDKVLSISAIDVVKRYEKVVVLGSPGSGKTVLLNHIFASCCENSVFQELVPVMILLRDYSGNNSLLDAVHNALEFDSFEDTEQVLESGKALFLLDGLDEVRFEERVRLEEQISQLSNQFPRNRFVITSRVISAPKRLDTFQYVEMANFDRQKVEAFVENWFRQHSEASDSERLRTSFIKGVSCNNSIMELASNPMLLSLLCNIFLNSGTIPADTELTYDLATEILIEKWEFGRKLKWDKSSSIYSNLTTSRRKNLFAYIANKTFSESEYFFEKERLLSYISEYLSTSLEQSYQILAEVEQKTGILVKRPNDTYSFTHLVIHEYLAGQFNKEDSD